MSFGYYAQEHETLDAQRTVLENMRSAAPDLLEPDVRKILGSFLFHGDDVFKRVGVLSGGEKSRLALAKMLLQPANVLVMDEPTNHLDMRSKRVLQEALLEYDGTYVIVSHDRSFLEPLVNKVLEVSVTGVRTYLGSLADYIAKKKKEQADAIAASNPAAAKPAAAPKPAAPAPAPTPAPRVAAPKPESPALPERERKRLEAERRQVLSKKLKPHREKLEKLERSIEQAESRKLEIEMLMADPEFYKDGDAAKKVSQEYREVQATIERHYAEWTALSEEIAAIERSTP